MPCNTGLAEHICRSCRAPGPRVQAAICQDEDQYGGLKHSIFPPKSHASPLLDLSHTYLIFRDDVVRGYNSAMLLAGFSSQQFESMQLFDKPPHTWSLSEGIRLS